MIHPPPPPLSLQVVSKKRDEFDVEHNEGRRWNYVRLTLPPYIPETRLEFCDIIEIEYLFQFRVEISGGAELKMEIPILIGSHPYGQGLQRQGDFSPQAGPGGVNRNWTVRGQGPGPEDEGEAGGGAGEYRDQADLGDPRRHFGVSSGVPELRGEKVVVNNPLFRHGSFLTRPGKEPRDLPEEQMENTRL